MRIGVFDSGIGGKTVADTIGRDFPDAEIMYVDDKAHMPYGNRATAEVILLTDTAIQPLLVATCDIIVLACNTATAAAIETLRARYPHQSFIGLEPMVKPAALQSQTGVITICATPSTLASTRYQHLKQTYGDGIRIIEPNCSTWAQMIEEDNVNRSDITHTIETVCQEGADVIVLACTHYHWIRELIEKVAADRAIVIDPSEAISRRIRELLVASPRSDK